MKKGTKQSLEARRKMSLAKAGYIPWNKGKKLSEEHRRNLSKSHMGNPGYNKGKGKPSENPYTINEQTGCWEARCVSRLGYGSMWNGKEHVLQHRYMYEKYKGKIPEGLEIDHLCRNKKCCNPEHLEAVTPAVNNQRRKDTKLNWDIVNEIRRIYAIKKFSRKEISIIYKISRSHIDTILRNEAWKNA